MTKLQSSKNRKIYKLDLKLKPMGSEEYKLPQLPSLKDLEARADKQLSEGSELKVLRLTETICPVLERYIAQTSCLPRDKRPSARIQFMGEKVACEKHKIEIKKSVGRYSFCTVTNEGCPYSTLPSYKALTREKL